MSQPERREGDAQFSPAYSSYVLGLLFVAYVFNFVDRNLLNALLQPVKEELGASDFVMGLLTGTAFALFYAGLGIPIARWADLWVRRSIISLGLALWSGMTAATGLAQNLLQLSLARIGVGVGEAALSPPAHSLLSDYFPPERRATALSIYAVGIHVGILFSLTLGGWLGDQYGWRTTFLILGLPGLALAALVRLTVREPVRPPTAEAPAVRDVVVHLWRLRSFRHLSIAIGLTAFAGYSFTAFAPAFLQRVHDLSSTEAGRLGYVLGVGGAIGSIAAGVLADRLGRQDVRWWLWVPAIATVGPLPFTLAFLFHGEATAALLWSLPGFVVGAFYQGPTFSTVQTLAPPQMRAVASGVLLFVTNVIGLACGPPVVGLLNDYVFVGLGEEAVRYSLASTLLVMGGWGLVHYLLAARALRDDLRGAARA